LAGAATGLALAMKFSAVLLAPIFVLLLLARWREARRIWKWLPLVGVVAWLVLMLVYAPEWKPAPALSAAEAERIGVPGWFQKLRPVLVPPGFFKGIAMVAAHGEHGHEAFLWGEWSTKGWWYYFPLALWWKLPVPFLLLTVAGLGLWLARVRRWNFSEAVPWVAALAWLALAMLQTINIGVRHVLPMMPLLAVGAAQQWSRLSVRWRVAGWALCGWLAVAMAVAYPFYIEYFNEFAGGTRNGYRCLVDSNYDWGQDAKRLQAWLAARGNPKVYLRFFGPGKAIQHYGIRYEPASPEKARQAKEGLLVISASALMKPDWRWLDQEHKPLARIGQTLLVYEIGALHREQERD
jgi:4-amino-4-deoxy-L-arabinose transferase-like glycosyltransferase